MRGGLLRAIILGHEAVTPNAATTFKGMQIIRDDWRKGLIDHPEYLASIYRSREELTLTRYSSFYAVGICVAEAHIGAKE